MRDVSLNDLIVKTVDKFNSSDVPETSFERGNQLEVLSIEGKEHLKQSMINSIKDDLNVAKVEARKLLLERETVSLFNRFLHLSDEEKNNLDERYNNAQTEYELIFKKVTNLEVLLKNFE